MTQVSRLAPLPPRRLRPHRHSFTWHAVCFILGMPGCIYLGPLAQPGEYDEVNSPPELLSNIADRDTIAIGPAGVRVYVHVDDPDDDDVIEMIWLLSDGGYVHPDPIDERSEQVVLDYDLDLDGQELQCRVSDGENPRVTFVWPLEVLQ